MRLLPLIVHHFILSIVLNCIGISTLFAANSHDILGHWKTYDLSGKARSVIHFYQLGHEYRADVIKVLDQSTLNLLSAHYLKNDKHHLNPSTIIYGLKAQNDAWVNGEVLDTSTGKKYHCSITLSEDGRTMHFHAYIFKPLFGRTIDWVRLD